MASTDEFQIRLARPGDEEGIARTHIESWQATYRNIIPDSAIQRQSLEQRRSYWTWAIRSPRRLENREYLAVADSTRGGVEGFVYGGTDRVPKSGYDAELYSLYLLPSVQGMGLGRRLLAGFAEWLGAHAFQRLRLWVLEDNPAREFYVRLGASQSGESQPIVFDGAQFLHVAYGWPSVQELIRNLDSGVSAASQLGG